MGALFTYFWKIKVFICKSEVYKLISSIKIKLPNGEVVSKLSYLIGWVVSKLSYLIGWIVSKLSYLMGK